MVYCKMENIVSPTGAAAEGWLISVGGTPKGDARTAPSSPTVACCTRPRSPRGWARRSWAWARSRKVVSDAGVTVARRAHIPITTGNSYSASGALWAAADAMKRMGLVQRPGDGKRIAARTW